MLYSQNYEEFIEQQRLNRYKLLEKEQLEKLDNHSRMIYEYIKENVVVNLEIICSQLNLSIQEVSMSLTVLELNGLILSKPGGNYCICDQF